MVAVTPFAGSFLGPAKEILIDMDGDLSCIHEAIIPAAMPHPRRTAVLLVAKAVGRLPTAKRLTRVCRVGVSERPVSRAILEGRR
jgi:hypothetical protein